MGFFYAICAVCFEQFHIGFDLEELFLVAYGQNVWAVVDILGGMHRDESA